MKKFNTHKEISSVVIIYAVFGCLWIFLSDTILDWFVRDPDTITRFSIVKGSLFIFTTSVLLYFLVARLSTKIIKLTTAQRESEELLHFIVNNSSDSLVIINADRRQSYVSPGAERVFGFLTSELEGRSLDTLIHPDDWQVIEDAWQEAVKHPEKIVTVQYRHIHKDRTWVFAEAIAQSFFNEPAINGLIASVRDITERKQAEEELARQKKLFETMFNTIPDGVVITDTNREIQLANKGMEDTFGYKPSELLGKTTAMLYADQDTYRHTGKAVLGQNTQKRDDRYITCYRKNNGQEFPGETFRAKLFDENKRWLGNLGIMRDISERIQQEEQGKMLQRQLSQAQKMESIGTLAGGIAHDFNNILGAIIGYAEMIRDDCPAGSATSHDINQVLKAGSRAKDLVKQILAFSRQAATELVPLKPVSIVKEALSLLRSSLPATIVIEQDIDADVGMILAEPTQIHQILMNLCTNAFHAMETVGGTLTVALHRKVLTTEDLHATLHLRPGSFVQLSVQDTGSGIMPEIREKIFEPFFTTKKVGQGTGMGLAMVHGIVQSYGGAITCTSKPGEGTVFRVILPIIDDVALHGQDPVEQTPTGKEHILLIDDEQMLLELGRTMLERLGYEVTAVMGSVEGLATFQNEPELFDIVITDQTMPIITGIDLSQRILQMRPDIPIILCTGYSSLITEEKAKAMGIKGFAMKPLAKKDIARLIRKVLDGKK